MRDNPSINPEIAVAWAVNAKKSFPMNGGFSSYTLVFGKNPSLPNIFTDKLPALGRTTTSQSLANHMKAMFEGRTAFAATMCDEKICTALKHKLRSLGLECVFKQCE